MRLFSLYLLYSGSQPVVRVQLVVHAPLVVRVPSVGSHCSVAYDQRDLFFCFFPDVIHMETCHRDDVTQASQSSLQTWSFHLACIHRQVNKMAFLSFP